MTAVEWTERLNAVLEASGDLRWQEVDRLNQLLPEHRFAMEAIGLALAAFAHYDGDRLVWGSRARAKASGQVAYHVWFQRVAFDEYMRCPNVKLAAHVVEILIAEAGL